MLHRERRRPPRYVYSIDEWKIIEKQYHPDFLGQMETIFALSNGYLGMRGTFEEGNPTFLHGTFVNGFYETWPIIYGEQAYGFAKTGQTIVNLPDLKIIRLFVDDEPFHLPTADLKNFERVLDMRSGVLSRSLVWEMPSGKTIAIRSKRLVSFEHRHLAAISYEIVVLNASAPVTISSEIVPHRTIRGTDGDPRYTRFFREKVLAPQSRAVDDKRLLFGFQTKSSRMNLVCGCDHLLTTDCAFQTSVQTGEEEGKVVYTLEARENIPIHLTKFMTCHTSRNASTDELSERAGRTLDRAVQSGFEALFASQKEFMDNFWRISDVRIEMEPNKKDKLSSLEWQQAIRWNLFQLCQASARAEGSGIPAKGLTGEGYEGHYFWDIEIFALPFFIYTQPRIARNLLRFRYRMLDQARQRARDVNQKGALFPWRTINGQEASAYYAAGTAQYHINADIAYALKKYAYSSGDWEFLRREGAEILVETARLWLDLGFFCSGKNHSFCIHGVTGPDEYNAVVDNNTYTNLMARENLLCAAMTVERLQQDSPELFQALQYKTGLQEEEIGNWRQAAERMYVPYGEGQGIHLQDDSFLEKKDWDFAGTPAADYPLLLHYHPLVIYRHKVIKQADLVLVMFLLNRDFSEAEKRRNFNYYDRLTTGDSSLSVGIQSIMAFETGFFDKALEYARLAVLMDLEDVGDNVEHGCHIASLGATWMVLVYGMAGLRDRDGRISFSPRIPCFVRRLQFKLIIRGQLLEVVFSAAEVAYTLASGQELIIYHEDREVRLTRENPSFAAELKKKQTPDRLPPGST
ncbi:MAG: glycoside hydrolase family 65 protein [Thermodesulfobacteriota bacterium]